MENNYDDEIKAILKIRDQKQTHGIKFTAIKVNDDHIFIAEYCVN